MSACLGNCGREVGEGQKCHECAARAVTEWLDRRKARELERERKARPRTAKADVRPRNKARKPGKRKTKGAA